MALTDIVMIESDIIEPMTEIPLGTLSEPLDEFSDIMMNDLTLVFEVSYSS